MIKYCFAQPLYNSNFDSSLLEFQYRTHKQWESSTTTSFKNFNNISQKSHNILVNELLKYTKQVITKEHQINLYEIWANEYMEKEFQEPHTHPRSHFSFTIIHKCPEESGRLKFYNPYEQLEYAHEDIFFKCGFSLIEPAQEENTIIIWPSYMKHMVTPGSNKTKRITYSGNFKIIV